MELTELINELKDIYENSLSLHSKIKHFKETKKNHLNREQVENILLYTSTVNTELGKLLKDAYSKLGEIYYKNLTSIN